MIPAAEAPAPSAAGAPGSRPARWWWFAPPALLTLLGVVALARGHGLWYDEVYTSEMARVPFGDLVEAFVRGEGTVWYLRDAPPSYNAPYYAAVHVWLAVTRLVPDELGLRLLSLAAAVAAVTVLTRAVDRLAGPRVACAAGVFAAANPFVVQYSVEARGYALALLATCTAALGLARWLDGRSGLLLYALGSAAAGLLHWYALLATAGLALAAVVLRRRRAVPVVACAALAALPAAAVAAVAVVNGVGASGVEWLRGVGAQVPWLVLQSWSGRSVPLLLATLGTAALGLLVRGRARTVAVCWLALPLAAVTAAELVRPMFVDRYLLPAATGLAVLAALGVASRRAAVAVPVAATVLAVSLAATATDLRRPPKDDVRRAVALVASRHRPGEPVVAAARWDALGVDHYVRRRHPGLAGELVLASAGVPAASTVWVVRRARGGVKGDVTRLEALDRDLAGLGLGLVEERRFDGRYADVLVQRWAVAQASVRTD